MIEDTFATVLADPAVMATACAAADPPIDAPIEICTALLAASDVSEDDPFVAMERLELQLIKETSDA
jgi:hypothetical protein